MADPFPTSSSLLQNTPVLASPSLEKVLTPNIQCDDSCISSQLLDSDLSVVLRVGRVCINMQERNKSCLLFLLGRKEQRGMRGRETWLADLSNKHRHKCWPLLCVIFVCGCLWRRRSFPNSTYNTTAACLALKTCSWTHTHTDGHRSEPIREDGDCTVISNCHSSTSDGSCPASVSIIVY